jgi:hypothetical protein
LQLPAASYVKLRPHSQEFLDLATAIGPRELLEMAMRNYSALSVGERILVDLGDGAQAHAIDIVELKPAKAASLYGNIDLEVDFAPIKVSQRFKLLDCSVSCFPSDRAFSPQLLSLPLLSFALLLCL